MERGNLSRLRKAKKPKRTSFRLLRKNWRQPTLAESIKPLPSARLCLTAVFGMGTGRTTALWPPRKQRSEIRSQRSEETDLEVLSLSEMLKNENVLPAVAWRSLKTAHRRC